jgi:protein-S-isoprenylcysteine O-methyltransferase Ste14
MRHLAAILILPINAIIVIPGILYFLYRRSESLTIYPASLRLLAGIPGALLILGGLYLLVRTIQFFRQLGQGTLAPWSPTQKLVVHGVYRYVRNPMISGVIGILLGETLLLNNICLLAWVIFFTLANLIYIPLSEEPGLEKRFGAAYRLYKQHVPRWIPRLKGWDPPAG